jgi:hypothetical protein
LPGHPGKAFIVSLNASIKAINLALLGPFTIEKLQLAKKQNPSKPRF